MKKLILVVVFCSVAIGAAAQQATSPRLVVVISVDQLRYDYVERFAPWFSNGGFNRFIKSGATFPNTHYTHAVTFTGPGHAAIGTGATPSENGIVSNIWYEPAAPFDAKAWKRFFAESAGFKPANPPAHDPAAPTWWQTAGGRPRYCAYDDSVQVTAGKTIGMSPRSLLFDTLGDRLKMHSPASRVISVALKDRAAILMAGKRADAAYWFDPDIPGFVSSTWYRFNPRVFSFNETVTGYLPASGVWNRSPFIPGDEIARATFDPPEAWPLKNNRYGGTFPHPATTIPALLYTAFGNDLLADFAFHVIATESLGSGSAPDLMMISFSSTDYFGHSYGPDSMEVADGMVRLDRTLERLFSALERRFGDSVVVALTADHGVQSNPRIVRLRDPKADVGGVDLRNARSDAQFISELSPLRIEIERRASAKLGIRFSPAAPLTDALVVLFEEPGLFLNRRRIAELKLSPDAVARAVREAAASLDGVQRAWTSRELMSMRAPAGLDRMMRVSLREGRSADVLIALRPGWVWSGAAPTATHGQPSENDTHVPLMFWGAGIKPGRYEAPAAPIDLARTLGTLVGVEAGGKDAKALPCVK